MVESIWGIFLFFGCRLFVVCQPRPPPLYALKDVFGRFGNLIDIFMLNGKNHGYAKYATKRSADEAMEVNSNRRCLLNGKEVFEMSFGRICTAKKFLVCG